MKRWNRWDHLVDHLAIAIFLSFLLASGIAHAETPRERAEANRTRIMEAIEVKDFERAVLLARESQQLVPGHWDFIRHEAWVFWQWAHHIRLNGEGFEAAKPYYEESRRHYERAINAATKALADPIFMHALYQQLGQMVLEMNDFQTAHWALSKALEYRPDHPKTHYLIGGMFSNAIYHLGDPTGELAKKAYWHFERAVDLDDGVEPIPWAYFYTAVDLYINEGDPKRIIELLEEFIDQLMELRNGRPYPDEQEIVDDALKAIAELRAK